MLTSSSSFPAGQTSRTAPNSSPPSLSNTWKPTSMLSCQFRSPSIAPPSLSGHEDRAEPHAVRHHLAERLFGLLERDLLDAGANAGERAERHRLLGVDRAAARPPGDRLAREERERRDLERL